MTISHECRHPFVQRAMRLGALAGSLMLTACQSLPMNEGKPASLADVVGKIKSDVAVYQTYDAAVENEPPQENRCRAAVGFSIESVKVSLLTETDNTVGGSIGAKVPTGIVTIGPSLSRSSETKGTQTTTFSLYPKPRIGEPPAPSQSAKTIDAAAYPIAAALQRLREGLLAAANQHSLTAQTCFSLSPLTPPGGKAPDDPGGTYVFGFTVVHKSGTDGKIELLVFSLGASANEQTTAANTLTVAFKARPGKNAGFT